MSDIYEGISYLKFNGVATNDKTVFDAPILIEHFPSYIYPERDVTVEHIPGRNGDIIIDNGCYKNFELTLDLAIGDEDVDYYKLAYELSAFLHPTISSSNGGYFKLWYSEIPDVYYMASYVETNAITNILNHMGRVTVKFNCKPQRFLVNGDIAITSPGTLTNNTDTVAEPIFKVAAGDTLTVNNVSVTNISGGTVIINSDTKTVSVPGSSEDNVGAAVIFNSGVFPTLKPGVNTISGAQEVIPKWWVL